MSVRNSIRDAIRSAIGLVEEVFNPQTLFLSGEQGVWYDPSDLSTLFQDAAGTIPVTGTEQPVGLMLDKSKGLVLGPELVTNGAFDTNTTGWAGINANSTLTWQSGGTALFQNVADFAYVQSSASLPLVSGRSYQVTFDVIAISHTSTVINVGPGAYAFNISPTIPKSYSYVHKATGPATFQIRPNNAGVGTIQIDNISIKLLPGNHATQPTAGKRPVLSSRVNLLTHSEDFTNAAWGITDGTKAAGSLPGLTKCIPGVTSARHLIRCAVATNYSRVYVRSIVKPAGYTTAAIGPSNSAGVVAGAVFSLVGAGSFVRSYGYGGADYIPGTANITANPDGTYLLEAEFIGTNTFGAEFHALPSTASYDLSYAGNGVDGVEFGFAQVSTVVRRYQRITTATDYDTEGFPLYLKGDGIDDFMSTAAIDFSGTDKLSVWAGVTKLNDTARIVAELSATSIGNSGSFFLEAGTANGYSQAYSSLSRGTSSTTPGQTAGYAGVPAPDTAALTITHDISGDLSTIKRNGVAGTNGTSDKGTGNFGNHPLYIASRAGTSSFFNGNLYPLVIAGALYDANTVAKMNAWTAKKTGVTI